MSEQKRKEFETHPRFKGMDFTRSSSHPQYYESPYANGAWDGWKAATETPAPFEKKCKDYGHGGAWCGANDCWLRPEKDQ